MRQKLGHIIFLTLNGKVKSKRRRAKEPVALVFDDERRNKSIFEFDQIGLLIILFGPFLFMGVLGGD